MDPEQRQKLKIKAVSYRLAAAALAVMGLIIFSMLYYTLTNGDATVIFHNPVNLILLIFPFIPAAILSMIATRTQKKLEDAGKE